MGKVRNLAVVGLGNVGKALIELLLERSIQIRVEYGLDLRVTGLMSRRIGMVADPSGLDLGAIAAGNIPRGSAYDASAVGSWLERAAAHVLIELSTVDLASGQPAKSFLEAALRRGIHGVTANKGPVVHAYRSLTALADASGARFRFESATADCLPVYNLYRESLPLERPKKVRGLVNSTTSVILEAIEAGSSFEDGIKIAQDRGVAEADPSLDIDGFDAAVKVVAIANVLMDADLRVSDVEVTGIRGIDVNAVREAAQAGTPMRIVATVERIGDSVKGRVGPVKLVEGDPFRGLDAMALGLHFEGDLMPGLTVVGHGLEPRQTAYGVLVDVLGVLRGR
ncbi:homoserine dehydrogenase [Hyaloraphidium curvatum]|nr:homoserine dehydrogenase [Hyaloraphidium curvatum]